jgi:hypothetical protein
MGGVLRLAIVVSVLGLAVSAAGSESARGSKKQLTEYTLAEVPYHEAAGAGVIASQLEVWICLRSTAPSCDPDIGVQFAPIGVADVGGTIWRDASSAPHFNNFVAEMTDGALDDMFFETLALGDGGGGTNAPGATDAEMFSGQAGLGGVDLLGYAIHRIGLRVEAVSIASPGTDPNGDGIWTDFTADVTFIFEGTIADTGACRKGGWQILHGPGGSSFKNQGQCIRLVAAGK